jgi:hypothetical protein
MPRASQESDASPWYCIRIREHIDPCRAAWFEGLVVTSLENGETLLTGPVADQAALHGLLGRIRDLNLTLIAVTPAEPADQGQRQTLSRRNKR